MEFSVLGFVLIHTGRASITLISGTRVGRHVTIAIKLFIPIRRADFVRDDVLLLFNLMRFANVRLFYRERFIYVSHAKDPLRVVGIIVKIAGHCGWNDSTRCGGEASA